LHAALPHVVEDAAVDVVPPGAVVVRWCSQVPPVQVVVDCDVVTPPCGPVDVPLCVSVAADASDGPPLRRIARVRMRVERFIME
jgi:hypothetical protein